MDTGVEPNVGSLRQRKDAAQQLTALTANIYTHTHTHTHTHDLGTGVEPDIGSLRHTHART